MKPDWKDAPEWASYFAKDRNGEWWWFEVPPEAYDNCWLGAGMAALASREEEEDNWRETIEQRPE